MRLARAIGDARVGFCLFARTRCSPRICTGVGVGLLVLAVLHGRSFITPVVPWDVIVVTTPLLPVVAAVLAVRCCDSPMEGLEDVIAPRRVTRVRLAWAAALTLALAGASALALAAANLGSAGTTDPGSSPGAVGRNAAAFFALGLLTAVVLGGDLGWTTPVLLVAALIFFGRDPDQVVRGWALPLRGSGDASAALAVLLLVVLAAAAYARWDTRGVLSSKG